jgi:hypothetical protein
MKRRHEYNGATAKQRAYIAALATKIAGTADLLATSKVMLEHGAPQNEHTGAIAGGLTKFGASLMIDSLLRATKALEGAPAVDSYCPPDPGELAADRWNEVHS